DPHQVLRRDAGIAERQLERRQSFSVVSNAFSEEDPLGDHLSRQFFYSLPMSRSKRVDITRMPLSDCNFLAGSSESSNPRKPTMKPGMPCGCHFRWVVAPRRNASRQSQ